MGIHILLSFTTLKYVYTKFQCLIIHKTLNMSTLWKEFETFYDELKIGFT